MAPPFAETIAVIRGTPDKYGDKDAATSHFVEGAVLWPAASPTETTGSSDIVSWTLTALIPPGSDILSTDQIAYQGVIYDIVGQPMAWRSAFTGYRPGIELHLIAATG